MRSKEQILAEVVDTLIRQGEGHAPPEIAQLAEIGTRLHNECADADPAFLQRLERRLRAEWTPPGRVQTLLAALSGWRPRLSPRQLRTATGVLAAALLLAALSARSPLLHSVEASLGQAISFFRQARLEQWPGRPSRALPTPEVDRFFSSLEEAQAAGYTVRTPAYLPPGLALINVIVAEDQGQQRLILQYGSPYADVGAAREYVTIQQFRADREETFTLQWDLSGIERLEVAGRPALWMPREAPASLGSGKPQPGDGLLVQGDDILIQLLSNLGRDESVRIAESMFR